MLRARAVTKSYAGRAVLERLDLDVAAGEVFGFVGPNGAGKTTFLKCLTAVARPDSGSITVRGIDAVGNSLKARRLIGYAPGDTALYHRMTAAELLHFAVAFHPHGDPEYGRALLEGLGVPPGRRAGRLSHGMKKKLLICQALASRAPLIVLDEPMEGLDPEARRVVERLLREVADQPEHAVLFSSHDLASVERVCDRVAFLRGGLLLEAGAVGDLMQRAASVLRVGLREARTLEELPRIDGASWSGSGRDWSLQFDGPLEDVCAEIRELPIASLRNTAGSLEEVFEALYEGPSAPRETR